MPPFHPCGRAVDYLRSCYATNMRFFSDNPEIKTPVVWYFVVAAPLGFRTVFGSGNWASSKTEEWPGVGEVWGDARPWRSGTAPADYQGLGYCGTPDMFAAGVPAPPVPPVPVRDNGAPVCCWFPFPSSGGGALGDGGASFRWGDLLADGGALADGASSMVHKPDIDSAGGAIGDSLSTFKSGPDLLSGGGAKGDGTNRGW